MRSPLSAQRLRPIALVIFSVCFLDAPDACGQMSKMGDADSEPTVGFDQVQPILRKRCQNCHNPEELRGDFSVVDMTAIQTGSSSGPVIVPFKPKESLLYTTTAHLDEPTMPPNSRKIPAREIDVIRRWIEGGLARKTGDVVKRQESNASPSSEVPSDKAEELGSSHFQPIATSLRATSIPALATHPKEPIVALAGNQQVVLLNLNDAELKKSIAVKEEQITQIRFSNDGTKIFVAGGTPGLSGSVYTFDSNSGEQLSKVADENDSILALDVSPDFSTIAIGGPSKVLRLLEPASGTVRHTLRKHTDWVLATAFSPDGLLCASADRFGGLFVWETQSGELFHTLRGHQGPVHSLAWDSDGETLVSGGEDGIIRIWNMHHGELTAQWDAGVGPILDLDRASGITIAAGRDSKVVAWRMPEVATGTFECSEQLDHVRISTSAERAIASDSSGKIHVLSLPELESVATVELPTREDAIAELLARLEKQNSEFLARKELELEKERTLAAGQKRAASASEAIEYSKVAGASQSSSIALLLESEIAQARMELSRQEALRDLVRQQQRDLASQIAAHESLIENTQQRILRLTKAFESLGSSSNLQAARLQSLEEQLAEQQAMLKVAEALRKRALEASSKTTLTKVTDWNTSLAAIARLTEALSTQATSTEQAIYELTNPSQTPAAHLQAATRNKVTEESSQ